MLVCWEVLSFPVLFRVHFNTYRLRFMFETSRILMFMIGPIHVHCKCLTVSQKSVDLLEIFFCGNQHYAPPTPQSRQLRLTRTEPRIVLEHRAGMSERSLMMLVVQD